MPWVSRHKLERHIREHAGKQMTLHEFHDEIEKYVKRAKKTCGCDTDRDCDCVLFGMYANASEDITYEYFVPL